MHALEHVVATATPSNVQSCTRMLVIGASAKPRSRKAYLLLRLVTLRTSTSRRIGVKAPLLPFLVEEVGGDDRLGDLADGDVAHRDPLDQRRRARRCS